MAIDSAEKRRSLSGIQVTLMPGVTPNASKDQEWRQEAGWFYSGIVVATITILSNLSLVSIALLQSTLTSVISTPASPSLANVALAKSSLTNITLVK